MSTRSVIIRYNTNTGKFDCAYKHHDGYSNAGILNLLYNTPEKAEAFLNAIMRPGVELRVLRATLNLCAIDEERNGYHTFEAPADDEDLVKYIPAAISHCDAEFITLYTPHGWKEFALVDCVYFSEERMKEEEDLSYLSRMKKNNETLEIFVDYLRHLAAGKQWPESWPEPANARTGKLEWGYIWGDKHLTPEEKLFPLDSQEAKTICNLIAKDAFGCKSSNAWEEFTQCTGARLLYVSKAREVCFRINPRLMANKANVVKVLIYPENSWCSAEFYKVSTGKNGKKIKEISCYCAGHPLSFSDNHTSFLESFRNHTALQTHFPVFASASTPAPIPAWGIEAQTGYKPIADYWQKLYRAARNGSEELKRLATGLFDSAKHSYKHLTEFVMALNWLSWEWVEKNEAIARLFCSLFRTAEDFARENLTGEELKYYFATTD